MIFSRVLHALHTHQLRLNVVQRFRTPTGATFKAHWCDLHRHQFSSRAQGLDRGYISTPLDVWLNWWGLLDHEGRMRRTWRALMWDVLPRTAYDTLEELTALEVERRSRWLKPGGYFYEAVSKERENTLRLRCPRPWRLDQTRGGRSVSKHILIKRRKRANKRKPRKWQLDRRTEVTRRDLKFLVQWWLGSTNLDSTFGTLEAIVLAMTGIISGKMEGKLRGVHEHVFHLLRDRKRRRKRSFVIAPRVHLRDPRRFKLLWTPQLTGMLFLPSEPDRKVRELNTRMSLWLHSLWAAVTLGDRLRKLRECGVLYHPEDASSVGIEPAMGWGWISRIAAAVGVAPARPNDSNRAVYPPSLTERYGAVESIGSTVMREEVRDPWGTLMYKAGTEVEICGKLEKVWVVRDVDDPRANVQMVARHLCREQ